MAVRSLADIINVGVDILATIRDATGLILTQIGDVTTNAEDSHDAEWWQHVGFVSRPPKPVSGKKAAQSIVVKSSSHDLVIASRDHRGADLAGEIGEGETCIYAAGSDGSGQARILLKSDNSITLFTQPDANGTSVAMQLRADGTYKVFGPLGAITLDSGGLTLLAGQSGIQLKSDGTVTISCTQFQVNGNVCNLNTGSVCLGAAACLAGPGGLTNPPPAPLSVIHGSAGATGVASATVTCSP